MRQYPRDFSPDLAALQPEASPPRSPSHASASPCSHPACSHPPLACGSDVIAPTQQCRCPSRRCSRRRPHPPHARRLSSPFALSAQCSNRVSLARHLVSSSLSPSFRVHPPLTFAPLRHLHPPAAFALVCKQERERTTSRRTQVRRHHLPVTFALDSPPHPRAALTLPSHSRPIHPACPHAHGHTCIGYGYGYNSSRVSRV